MKRLATYATLMTAGAAAGSLLTCAVMDPSEGRGIVCGLAGLVGGAVMGIAGRVIETYRERDFGGLSIYDLPTEEIARSPRRQYP